MDALFEARDVPHGRDRASAWITVTGEALGPAFAAFLADRARRLDLGLHIESEAKAVQLHLTGHPTLIDMFEMAMILGPLEARVETVSLQWTGNRQPGR